MRVKIKMLCSQCKVCFYTTTKNKKNSGNKKLTLNKYCPGCRAKTEFNEDKIK